MIGTVPSVSCAVTLGINRVWIHYFQLVFLHIELSAHTPRIPASSLKILEACEEHLQNVGAGLPTPSRAAPAPAPPRPWPRPSPAPAPPTAPPRPRPRSTFRAWFTGLDWRGCWFPELDNPRCERVGEQNSPPVGKDVSGR